MPLRNPQQWLVKYTYRGKKEHRTTPMLSYKWQASQWLLNIKPGAKLTSVEPYRPLSVPKT